MNDHALDSRTKAAWTVGVFVLVVVVIIGAALLAS